MEVRNKLHCLFMLADRSCKSKCNTGKQRLYDTFTITIFFIMFKQKSYCLNLLNVMLGYDGTCPSFMQEIAQHLRSTS